MRGEFPHPVLDEEIRAVGGGYTFMREAVMSVDERPVLYLVGAAHFDTSCCGVGGCGYALVSGFIVEHRSKIGADGQPVSVVESIDDGELRRRITEHIKLEEMVQDVRFWLIKEEDS